MPEVRVRYLGLLRALAGRGDEAFTVPAGTTLRVLLEEIARRHAPERMGALIVTEGGNLADGVLVALEGGEKLHLDWPFVDDSQATVLVLGPMVSGGLH